MPEDETINNEDETTNVNEETPTNANETPSTNVDDDEPTSYTGKYCNSDSVLALIGELSDDATYDLLKTAIDNSEALIDSELRGNYVLIPTTAPTTLKTVAVYLSASDVLVSLYTGSELPVQYDIYWNKAHELLNSYIQEVQNNPEDESEADRMIIVKHSHSPTYNERHRKWER